MIGGVERKIVWRISRGITSILKTGKSPKFFVLWFVKKIGNEEINLICELFEWYGNDKYFLGKYLLRLFLIRKEKARSSSPDNGFGYEIKKIKQGMATKVASGQALGFKDYNCNTEVGFRSLSCLWDNLLKVLGLPPKKLLAGLKS